MGMMGAQRGSNVLGGYPTMKILHRLVARGLKYDDLIICFPMERVPAWYDVFRNPKWLSYLKALVAVTGPRDRTFAK